MSSLIEFIFDKINFMKKGTKPPSRILLKKRTRWPFGKVFKKLIFYYFYISLKNMKIHSNLLHLIITHCKTKFVKIKMNR